MKIKLDVLVDLSHRYGCDPSFIVGGGGNTSYKSGNRLFIKPSGVSLANITADDFLLMDRSKLSHIWNETFSDNPHTRSSQVLSDLMASRADQSDIRRPSVEVLLHDLLPRKYVVHTHPALVNGMGCSKNGKSICKKLFGDKALWIPYVDPGYVLAKRVKDDVADYLERFGKSPDILILENHGLLVAGDSDKEIKKHSGLVMQTLMKRVSHQPDFSEAEYDRDTASTIAPAIRSILSDNEAVSVVTFCTNRQVMKFVKSKKDFAPLSSAFSPDHIVFCRHEPLFVPLLEDKEKQYLVIRKSIAEYRRTNGFPPVIIAIRGLGFFAINSNKKSADISKTAFLDAVKVAVFTESFGGPRFMTNKQIDFINKWEMESYRKKIVAGAGRGARIQGKVCIVTGAAQGFGKGIAESLCKEGGYTVIADVNEPVAQATASEINTKSGAGSAMAIQVNVADEESVRKMVADTVLAYGGIDVLVSNAGILRAGNVDEMELKTFDLMTKVNYTAYFLCVKYISRIMKIQHRFSQGKYFDIIQINSKSGLQGSKANFTYAGGKFGGIGLTQSFAMELVEYGIKVNSICPGNFFEGPLWSDPQNGLFIQYLRAKKVPGAKSIADIKKFYESKVPMGRGCSVEDVAKAILYVIDQEYETGQAIPVTGGQVMLK